MSDKKLTKVQKEILEMMRDKGAKIVWSRSAGRYRLYLNGSKLKTVQSDTFHFLKPWLDRTERDTYTFKPGAEISDAWRSQELERHRVERQQAQAERERVEREILQALTNRLKSVIAAILSEEGER